MEFGLGIVLILVLGIVCAIFVLLNIEENNKNGYYFAAAMGIFIAAIFCYGWYYLATVTMTNRIGNTDNEMLLYKYINIFISNNASFWYGLVITLASLICLIVYSLFIQKDKKLKISNKKSICILMSIMTVFGVIITILALLFKINASPYIVTLENNNNLKDIDYSKVVNDMSFKEKTLLIDKAQDIVDEYMEKEKILRMKELKRK